ncbi:MAG TPA: NUDIX domain-containing protein [Flavobacteriales bacterium]|nr:NUDIX domain-containing protein [Flavobacteriales bacterium]
MSKLGAIVVILDKDNKVLILRRAPGDYWGGDKWAYPGGKIETGETPEQAAIRETKEETTLTVSNLKEIELGLDKPVSAYYTRDYNGNVKIDFEHTDWAWAGMDEIKNYDLAPDTYVMYEWALNNG